MPARNNPLSTCVPRLVFLAGLAALASCRPAPETEARPNVLFVFTDDHAAQALGAYGGRLAQLNPTPNLDRLASEGMLFRNAFVTNSICAPSRAVILTGRHSHLNGVLTNRESFDGSQTTFPKLLRAGGYQTALVGKWHLKSEPTGFDYWEVLPGQGHYYNPDFRTPQGQNREIGYVTDLITDKAIHWLSEGREPDRPFLLMYQHKAPHREWAPGPDELTLYDDVQIPEPPTLFDDYQGRASPAALQEMTIARHLNLAYDLKVLEAANPEAGGQDQSAVRLFERLTEEQQDRWQAAYGPKNREFIESNLEGDDLVRWKYQRYLKDYLRAIAAVDRNLGRVLDTLDRLGLAENTVVVYSSDQGFYLGEHGWYDKRWMYEESLRTPLIVRWPKVVEPGSENRHLVQNLDFAQTFLELAGVEAPDSMQGRSLVSLLKGIPPRGWREAIYYHYYEFPGVHAVRRHEGVRNGRHKLIHYYESDEWELFDLEEDPLELASVYGEPEYDPLLKRLRETLQELKSQYEVP